MADDGRAAVAALQQRQRVAVDEAAFDVEVGEAVAQRAQQRRQVDVAHGALEVAVRVE